MGPIENVNNIWRNVRFLKSWTKKPTTFGEVKGTITLSRRERGALPRYVTAKPTYDLPINSSRNHGVTPNPTPLLVAVDFNTKIEYLVNTEGYDYCRFVARLHIADDVELNATNEDPTLNG